MPNFSKSDGVVNTSDFAIFVSAVGSTCTGCAADLDQSGIVNSSDFSLFILAFGRAARRTMRNFTPVGLRSAGTGTR
jgi:hypothetical protein